MFPRNLFDAAGRCFLELPPLESSLVDEDEGCCGGWVGERTEGSSPRNASSTAAKTGPEVPCVVHTVTIVELDPEDLYRLAWAFTAAWINGEAMCRHHNWTLATVNGNNACEPRMSP